MNALRGLAVLLVLQAIGEALAHALALPFPGPVVGMILLIPALTFPPLREPVKAAAEALVGIIQPRARGAHHEAPACAESKTPMLPNRRPDRAPHFLGAGEHAAASGGDKLRCMF